MSDAKEKAPKKAANVVVKKLIDPEVLRRDLEFSPANLSDAMINQASMYAYYADIAVRAQNQADGFKQRVEITEVSEDKKIRDLAAAEGTKKTEKMIEAEIKRVPTVIKLTKMYNEAKMIAELSKQALEAWKQRRDMLVQLGIQAREELKGELRIAGASPAKDKLKETFK